MASVLRVALVQMSCEADRSANTERALALAERAARDGASIVCLQELFSTRYFPQAEDHASFDLAEPIPGPTTQRFAQFARRAKVAVLCPLFERVGPGVYYNSVAVISGSGELVGRYRKMHIPDDPLYFEKFYFAPGDLGFRVFRLAGVPVAPLICWDQWFPEAARIMTLKGAQILIYPTAIGWFDEDSEEEKQRQLEAWITVQRGHAIANGVPLVAVNRIGYEEDPKGHLDGIRFWGNSFVAGAQGEILARSDASGEEILRAGIDLERSEEVRRIWPFLRDRRIESYHALLKRYIDKN